MDQQTAPSRQWSIVRPHTPHHVDAPGNVLSEASQTLKTTERVSPPGEVFRTGKSTDRQEADRWSPGAGGEEEWGAMDSWGWGSFWGLEMFWNQKEVGVAQHCECTKCH